MGEKELNINIFSIEVITIIVVLGLIFAKFYNLCFKDFIEDPTSLVLACKTSKENKSFFIFIVALLLFTIMYFIHGEIKVGNEYEVLFKFIICMLLPVTILLGHINVNSKKIKQRETLSNREKTLSHQVKEKKYISKKKKKERQLSKAISGRDELNKSIKDQPYFLSQMIFLISMIYLTWGINLKELIIMAIILLMTRNFKKVKKVIDILISGYLILTLFITENPFFILGAFMFIIGLVVWYIYEGKVNFYEYKIPTWQLCTISLAIITISILASITTENLYIGLTEIENFTPCYIIIKLVKIFI